MEELIRQSTLLRDMIETDIQNTANDLEAQRLAVNYAFRNRIHEVMRCPLYDRLEMLYIKTNGDQVVGWSCGFKTIKINF